MSKRFLLKLSLSPVEINPSKIAETFFPDMNYDKSSIGCWFASMGEATNARNRLKKINPRAIYDIYGHPDSWDEATDMRKDLLMRTMEVDNNAPEPEIEDDAAIFGDNDVDPLDLLEELNPFPFLRGIHAISAAKSGAGILMFVRKNVRIQVTCEEAEAIAKISPQDICLVRKRSAEL